MCVSIDSNSGDVHMYTTLPYYCHDTSVAYSSYWNLTLNIYVYKDYIFDGQTQH